MYELRTGHKTESDYTDSPEGLDYTYIIVKKDTPSILSVKEYTDDIEITTELDVFWDTEDTIVGYGKTEKEAWESCWEALFPTKRWWEEKEKEDKKQWLVTIHSPYGEWYEPPSPKTKVFSSAAKAEEYKLHLESLIKKGSMDFVSCTEIQAE